MGVLIDRTALFLVVGANIVIPTTALASETVTYSYDTRGRMVEAAHSGTGPNAGLDIKYQYDKTNNRATQSVAGSKNAGQQVVVVPQGDGFNVIPINP